MTAPEDRPQRGNDYLGDSSVPLSLAVLKEELSKFLLVSELQVGWMNIVPTSGFLSEQPLLYQSILIRWIVKALRGRDTGFFKDLAKALGDLEHPALLNKNARGLIQSASALSSKGDPVLDSLLEKLRSPQWFRGARPEEIYALQRRILRRLDVKAKIFEKLVEAEREVSPGRPKEKKLIKIQKALYFTNTSQKTEPPFQADVVKHWEKQTGLLREQINVPREIRAAQLELKKRKSGRPRRAKNRSKRSGG
jgi:hypothetical protein